MEEERLNDRKIAIAYLFAIFFVTAIIAFTCNVFADSFRVYISPNYVSGYTESYTFNEGQELTRFNIRFTDVPYDFEGTILAEFNGEFLNDFSLSGVNYSIGSTLVNIEDRISNISVYSMNGKSYFSSIVNLKGIDNFRRTLTVELVGNYTFEEPLTINADGYIKDKTITFINLKDYINVMFRQLSIVNIILIIAGVTVITIAIVFAWWIVRKIYYMFMAASTKGKQRS